MRICYVPVKGVQFSHAHGLDGSQNFGLVHKVARRVQQNASVSEGWPIRYINVSGNLEHVVQVVPHNQLSQSLQGMASPEIARGCNVRIELKITKNLKIRTNLNFSYRGF